jgi:nucleotide-binding universal stress UspA family protein
VRPPWDNDKDTLWRTSIEQQLRRCLGEEVAATVDVAVVYDPKAYHGILVQAAAVKADLVIAGPPSGGSWRARMGGTTIERVVRSADVPCLIVRHPFERPVQHIAVATDLSPRARGASELAADWLPLWGHEAAQCTLLHVGAESARAELDREAGYLRTEDRSVQVALVNEPDVSAAVADWTNTHAVDLLVVTTEGQHGLRRLWNGSTATDITTRVACSVLWVPPTLWRRSPIPLRRVAAVIDPQAEDGTVLEWVEDRVVKAHRPLEFICVATDIDPNDLIRQTGSDLLVTYGARRPQDASPLNEDIRRLVESTPVPIFILRGIPDREIQHILVAVDTGELWYEKFAWAKLLTDRFDADVTILHAIDLSPASRVRTVPGGEFVSSRSVWLKHDVERGVVPAMRDWLQDRARLAGLPRERVDVRVVLANPWYAIPAVADQIDADLVIVAAHSGHEPGRVPLSKVARAVLEAGDYAVLAVVDRLRRERINDSRTATPGWTASDNRSAFAPDRAANEPSASIADDITNSTVQSDHD